MTTARQRQILEWLERAGAGSYAELAERLGVSTMTVRRDVDRLAAGGVIDGEIFDVAVVGPQRRDQPGLGRLDRRIDVRQGDIDGQGGNGRGGKPAPEGKARPQAGAGRRGCGRGGCEQAAVDRRLDGSRRRDRG
ncbi:MAG: DeoR family transcriptional regulator, partial [Rhizobiales bacterium]|nr:DeoR family transcriptional regulator [Hyphomicrobiales bacterium]